MNAFFTRRQICAFALLLSLSLFGIIKVVSSLAQATSQESTTADSWEVRKTGPRRLGSKAQGLNTTASTGRVIENQIPSHLPIEVELLNLKKEPLLRHLEIKVTNTANKPIYYLKLAIILPDIISPGGGLISFPLRYGRMDLIDFQEPLRPEDVPLQPGASFVFKVPESKLQPLETLDLQKNLGLAKLKKVYLIFQLLNFGDKTGFSLTNGSPIPNIPKDKSSNGFCGKGTPGEQASADVIGSPPIGFFKTLFQTSFGSVSFININNSTPNPLSQSGLCCPGSNCSFAKPSKYSCNCGEGDTFTSTGCQDPESKCSDSFVSNNNTCPDGRGGEYTCPEFLLQACSAYCDQDDDGWYAVSCGGKDCNDHDPNITPFSPECSPTPTPSPSPTPTPTPERGGGELVCDPLCQGSVRLAQPASSAFSLAAHALRPRPNVDPCCILTPLIIDLLGNGFDLTDAPHGVLFDFNADGSKHQISWTSAGSDDAWLVLDRNGNGTIDNGAELFGNATPQPGTTGLNGFLALAEFDRPANGGNSDALIDKRDAVFNSLRLWQDRNHNGISEPGELHTLAELGVAGIALDYKESRRTDSYGNAFRYRAKVYGARRADLGRWAFDVLLLQ